MTKKELIHFAKNYDQATQANQLKFEEQGANLEFRVLLSEAIKNDFSMANDQLIIDLFVAWSLQAKTDFGVYRHYHLLANELLEREGAEYLKVYAEGATQCMDTMIASGRLSLSKDRVTEILKYMDAMPANHQNQDELRLYHFLQTRFQGLSSQ